MVKFTAFQNAKVTDSKAPNVTLELMKAGYPPIDIKFTDRIAYYHAFDEYHVKNNLGAMEKLLAGYVNERLERYLDILEG